MHVTSSMCTPFRFSGGTCPMCCVVGIEQVVLPQHLVHCTRDLNVPTGAQSAHVCAQHCRRNIQAGTNVAVFCKVGSTIWADNHSCSQGVDTGANQLYAAMGREMLIRISLMASGTDCVLQYMQAAVLTPALQYSSTSCVKCVRPHCCGAGIH